MATKKKRKKLTNQESKNIALARKEYTRDATPEFCPFCGELNLLPCKEVAGDGTVWVGKCSNASCDRVFELSSQSRFNAETGEPFTYGEDEEE